MINVIFMGSSSFSIPALTELVHSDKTNLKAIITTPPKPRGRGQKMQNNILHEAALKLGVNENIIHAIDSLKQESVHKLIQNLKPDFIIVVAYGKIIPEEIIKIPKYKIVNLHPSSLPKYRGAAPIERAIENGESIIDICIMNIAKELDAGNIITSEKHPITNDEHASDIIPKVAKVGGVLMLKVIVNIFQNQEYYKEIEQDNNLATYASKINKDELTLDIQDDIIKLYNKIRAFNAYSGCYLLYHGVRIKIFKATLLEVKNNDLKVHYFNPIEGSIHGKNGIIRLEIIQLDNDKKMPFSQARFVLDKLFLQTA